MIIFVLYLILENICFAKPECSVIKHCSVSYMWFVRLLQSREAGWTYSMCGDFILLTRGNWGMCSHFFYPSQTQSHLATLSSKQCSIYFSIRLLPLLIFLFELAIPAIQTGTKGKDVYSLSPFTWHAVTLLSRTAVTCSQSWCRKFSGNRDILDAAHMCIYKQFPSVISVSTLTPNMKCNCIRCMKYFVL